jgi:diguanylate cyclase (GGDEF)-like protein
MKSLSQEAVSRCKPGQKTLMEYKIRYQQLFEDSPISLWEEDFSAVKLRLDEIQSRLSGDLRSFLLTRPDLIQELTGLIRILDVNQATLKLYSAQSKKQLVSGFKSILTEQSYKNLMRIFLLMVQGKTDFFWEDRHVSFTGTTVHVNVHCSVTPGYENDYGRVLVSIVDVTQHKKTMEELRQKEAMLNVAGDLARLGAWSVNLPENQVFWSHQVAAIHETPPGYCPKIEEIMNFYAPEFRDRITQVFSACVTEGVAYDEEMQIITRKGRLIWVRTIGVAEKDSSGNIIRVQCGIQDITERKQAEEKLRHLSLHDQLTGLYNRVYIENEKQRLSKSRDYPITIISMDVDGLKLVNDSLGHERGDELLKISADLLQKSLRASDILARYGGDEFVALLPNTGYQEGKNIVKRIRKQVESYSGKKRNHLPLNISIGMAVAEDESRDLETVFKEADDLMYRDKLGKNITVRSQIIRSLMAALEERDFITSGHAHRLEDLSCQVGEKIGLSEMQLSDLALLAQVHDLGKVGIPDHVLFKESPLTEEEWKIMHQHPEKGYRIARASNDLSEIAHLILKHHERWDGKGYPLGLKGEDIPVECRILAIVDAFDAMTNDRPYRKAMSLAQAGEELKKCAGTQFDPALVEVFLEIINVDKELSTEVKIL